MESAAGGQNEKPDSIFINERRGPRPPEADSELNVQRSIAKSGLVTFANYLPAAALIAA